MNAIPHALLIFQMLTLIPKYLLMYELLHSQEIISFKLW